MLRPYFFKKLNCYEKRSFLASKNDDSLIRLSFQSSFKEACRCLMSLFFSEDIARTSHVFCVSGFSKVQSPRCEISFYCIHVTTSNFYLNPASKTKYFCRNNLEMVESPSEMRQRNIFKEVHLFCEEEYTTRRSKKTTENQDGGWQAGKR